MSKIFECEMCQKEYSDVDENYVPRLLSCGHTCCHTCATKLGSYCMFCPFCHESVRPSGNVRNIPINFGLVKAIEISKYGVSKQETSLISPPKCTAHPSNLAEFVCKEQNCSLRDNLMCETCEESGIHQGHKKILLILEMDRMKVIFRGKIKDMESKCQRSEAYIEKIDEAVKKDEISVSTKLREVKEHFIEIRQLVSEQENKVLDEITKKAFKTLQTNYGRKNDMIEAQRSHVESLEEIKKQIEVNEIDLYLSNINLSRQWTPSDCFVTFGPRVYDPADTEALSVKLPNFKFEDVN